MPPAVLACLLGGAARCANDTARERLDIVLCLCGDAAPPRIRTTMRRLRAASAPGHGPATRAAIMREERAKPGMSCLESYWHCSIACSMCLGSFWCCEACPAHTEDVHGAWLDAPCQVALMDVPRLPGAAFTEPCGGDEGNGCCD